MDQPSPQPAPGISARPSGPTILTRSGILFALDAPTEAMIDIDDIAHALSNLCRFTGHTRLFYSVAEHSVLVSRLVPSHEALAALLHDASEAYLGDVSRPLKSLLPEYRIIEARVTEVIERRFSLGSCATPAIKSADRRMLVAEQRQAMGNHDCWADFARVEAAAVMVDFLSPWSARQMFIDRFKELTRGAGRGGNP